MDNHEFLKLRNSLSKKCVFKIVIYSIIAIIILEILVDGIFNDILAENTFQFSGSLYYWFIGNKTIIMIFSYFILFVITSFFVIRNSNKNIVEIISAMDKIMNNPEQEIRLPNDLIILENRLNNIRVNLVTNRNKAKEESQKKNDLIMYMAHDLKTPLTSVIGYLSLLVDEQDISKKMQEKYLSIALDKAKRLEDLTNQFFEITRYNLQELPIIKNTIDLSFLLAQLVDEFYPMLQEKNLKCILNKPEHVYFLGDGDKLARAFGNLIKNAISYSYNNTDIQIELSESDKKIHILFKNKGDSIPQYKLDKIFDKFYRADESRTSSTGGTGLGLAITKEIIELHNGSITVKNDDEYIEFCVEF